MWRYEGLCGVTCRYVALRGVIWRYVERCGVKRRYLALDVVFVALYGVMWRSVTLYDVL